MDFLKRQSVDYDKLDVDNAGDAIDLLTMEMVIKEGVSTEEAAFMVNRKFKDLKDLDEDDEDWKASKMESKFGAQKAKKFLKENQDKDRLPNPGSAKNDQNKIDVETRQKEWKDGWTEKIPEEISKAGALDINGTNYDLSEEDKKSIASTLSSRIVEGLDLNYTKKYYDKTSNTWDVQKMIADEAWKNEGIRGRILNKLAGNKADKDKKSLDGPVVPGVADMKETVSGQDEVDDLLSSLGF